MNFDDFLFIVLALISTVVMYFDLKFGKEIPGKKMLLIMMFLVCCWFCYPIYLFLKMW